MAAVFVAIATAFLSYNVSASSSRLADTLAPHEEATRLEFCHPDSSATAERVFEGVEKRIELSFVVPEADIRGLRSIERVKLDGICRAAKCEIIHAEPDRCFDSYILSESSLFVFRDRIMIKTCGTTLPLNSVQLIIDAAAEHSFIPFEMIYSRSSFVFPNLQLYPHDSMENESLYLSDMHLPNVVNEESYILGGVTGTYWIIHKKRFATGKQVVKPEKRVMIDCIMTGLAPEVCASYWKDSSLSGESDHEEIMSRSVESLGENFRVVGKAFDPCGFSANIHGIDNTNYMTVHVTPEEAFSYASVEGVFNGGEFEKSFIQNVVDAFRPSKLLITVLSTGEENLDPLFRGDVVDTVDPSVAYVREWRDLLTLSHGNMAASILYTKEK
jgi:S-adenosylmethionine decarboxylase